jgi:hypothetical protein
LVNRDDLIKYYINELSNTPFKKEYDSILRLMYKELRPGEVEKVVNTLGIYPER